jgi:hypothetical protein
MQSNSCKKGTKFKIDFWKRLPAGLERKKDDLKKERKMI